MRFSVLKQNLEYVASKMAAIVSAKAIKPILFGALIEVEDGKIKLSATDMETSVKMSLGESFLEGEGAFVVDAKLLEEVAKNTLSDQVHFTFEENRLTYRAQNSNYDLPFMEPDDFPPIHFIEEGQSLSFPRTVLIEMIEDVLYTCATDEMMKSLYCILWESEGKLLRLVGADGFRLSLSEQDIFNTEALPEFEDFRFLVSLKAMKELLNYLKEIKDDVVTLVYDGKRLCLGNESHRLLVRLMDYDYPDYRRVIPKTAKTKVVLDREEFLKKLRFVYVTTRTSGESVRFIFTDNELQMLARASDRGEADVEMAIQKEGNDLQIAFNPKFVIESVQHARQPKLELSFLDESSPMQINDTDMPRTINIIMPIRMI